jgi:hypothetical protein
MPKARAELRGANVQTARTSSDVRAAPDAAKAQGCFERALALRNIFATVSSREHPYIRESCPHCRFYVPSTDPRFSLR